VFPHTVITVISVLILGM